MNMARTLTTFFCIALSFPAAATTAGPKEPFRAIPFEAVRFEGGFWGVWQETLRRVTIPHMLDQCEKTGRTQNFDLAAAALKGETVGPYCSRYPFDDSDVYKVIEAASYLLHQHRDPELENAVDQIIRRIGGAQEKDGYLYTSRTFGGKPPQDWQGATRWSSLDLSHELYNIGHLMEAAQAHRTATGKTTLWNIAEAALKLVMEEFGPGRRENPPGHQEIELALVKWFRTSGDPRHLDLARFFLEARGRHSGRKSYGEYSQDHLPVVLQDKAVGHSVRAMYMYTAMADLLSLENHPGYRRVLETVWQDIVSSKMYLTGGLGSDGSCEGFGPAYHLPNLTAYAETCASVAAFFWQQRMFLASGDSRYPDVMERMLYNGILSGISLSGDRFFYTNPLASDGKFKRQPWFGCACCPPNVSRLIASLGGYIYAQRGDSLIVNLYAQSRADFKFLHQTWTVTQHTRYPTDGRVRLRFSPRHRSQAAVLLRIPGWARGKPVPSDLYRQLNPETEPVELRVNGRRISYRLRGAYAEIRRTWRKGDRVDLNLPMPVQRIAAHPAVIADRGKLALERGPLVYCLEDPDNEQSVPTCLLPADSVFEVIQAPDLFGGTTTIRTEMFREGPKLPNHEKRSETLIFIPYHRWAQREPSAMRVWIPLPESQSAATAPFFKKK